MNSLNNSYSGIVFHNTTFLDYQTLQNSLPDHIIKNKQIIFSSNARTAENDSYRLFLSGYILQQNKELATEDILKTYTETKDSFLDSVDGNFMIFVFDKTDNLLKVINSRHNSYAAYIYENKDFTIISSSINNILSILPQRPDFNKNALSNFLATGFNRSTEMQFKNIYRLQASHMITFDKAFPERKSYWNMPFCRREIVDINEKINTYERLFRNSVDTFIDVSKTKDLGCFLSGGQDTSMTFMYASKKHKNPVHTFTASFPYLKYNENDKARQVSDTFSGIHHSVPITEDTLDLIPQMVQTTEEPLSGGTLAIYACAKCASKYTDAIITGDGGDTYWGEYFPIAAWSRILSPLPYPIRKTAHAILYILSKATNYERFAEAEHVFKAFAQKDIFNDFFTNIFSYRQFDKKLLTSLLKEPYLAESSHKPYHYKIPFTKENMFDNLIESKILYGVLQYMNPPTEKSLNSFGIDFFTPYNNKALRDFLNTLPEDALNKGTIFAKALNMATKRMLHKQLMLRYFPQEFVFSSQQSLDMPYVYLIQKKKHLSDILLDCLIARGWYNEKTLRKIFTEFSSQKISQKESCLLRHHGYRIYSMLTFEVWAQIFLDKKVVPSTDTKLEDFLR